MSDYILINPEGTITNRVVLDDDAAWEAPAGHTIRPAGDYEIGGVLLNGVYTAPERPPIVPFAPQPLTVLPQDLLSQFTPDDATLIRDAVQGNAQFWLLWSALQAQKDPMRVANERFAAGWAALVQVLGEVRMAAIAATLGIVI